MDGFEDNTGVVVMAATNRPAALDNALTRPGRFDRIISMPLPNLEVPRPAPTAAAPPSSVCRFHFARVVAGATKSAARRSLMFSYMSARD